MVNYKHSKAVSISAAITIFLVGVANTQEVEPSVTSANASIFVQTGEQMVVTDRSGAQVFSGHTLQLDNLSGILGRSSDAAYVLVADGKASAKDLTARAGDVIILPPYGAPPQVERFDAKRFLAAWTDERSTSDDVVYAALKKVERKQKRLLFWGRYETTDFNLSAPGSAEVELARRSIVGTDVISKIRFSAENDPARLERLTIEHFVKALAGGDVESVSSLLDPSPFGRIDLRDGGNDARMVLAKRLIDSDDWDVRLQNASIEGVDGVWRISSVQGSTIVILKPLGDFAFVQSVENGA